MRAVLSATFKRSGGVGDGVLVTLGRSRKLLFLIVFVFMFGMPSFKVFSSQQEMRDFQSQYHRAVRYRWRGSTTHIEALQKAKNTMMRAMKKGGVTKADILREFGKPDEVRPWIEKTERGVINKGIVWNYYLWLGDDYEFGDYPDEAKIEIMFGNTGNVYEISEKTSRFVPPKTWKKEQMKVSQTVGDEEKMSKLLRAKSKFRIGMKSDHILVEFGLPDAKRGWIGVIKTKSGEILYYEWFYEAQNTLGDKYRLWLGINNDGIIVKITDSFHRRLSRELESTKRDKFAPAYYRRTFVYPHEVDETERKRILDSLSVISLGMNVEDIVKALGKPDEITAGFLRRTATSTSHTNLVYYLRTHAGPSASYYERNEWKLVFELNEYGEIKNIVNIDSSIWPPL